MKTSSQKSILSAFLVGTLIISSSYITQVSAQVPTSYSAEQEVITEAELAQLLAPIALYPDSLLTHILIASTYPLEVVDAERWRTRIGDIQPEDIESRSRDKSWDPSVKALLLFPTVLEKLSSELDWMQQLGDAFLEDEAAVLASIQSLRQKADDAGNLAQMDNVKIVREEKVIVIEPERTEVVYVPYYDTRVVYGNWHWVHYPPVHWHSPHRYAYYNGPYYWHSGVHISVGFYFSAFHWHKRHIVINHHHNHWHHPRKKVVTSHHAKKWIHAPSHRRGVAYRSERVAHKYHSKNVVTRAHHHKNKAIKVDKHAKSITNYSNRSTNHRDKVHAKITHRNKHKEINSALKRDKHIVKNKAIKVSSAKQKAAYHHKSSMTQAKTSSVKQHSSQKLHKNNNYHHRSDNARASNSTKVKPKSNSTHNKARSHKKTSSQRGQSSSRGSQRVKKQHH